MRGTTKGEETMERRITIVKGKEQRYEVKNKKKGRNKRKERGRKKKNVE